MCLGTDAWDEAFHHLRRRITAEIARFTSWISARKRYFTSLWAPLERWSHTVQREREIRLVIRRIAVLRERHVGTSGTESREIGNARLGTSGTIQRYFRNRGIAATQGEIASRGQSERPVTFYPYF